ncbi:MAG: hypothetical protein ACOYEG_12855 [Petrimonas sp.]|jgi:hypothetical protein
MKTTINKSDLMKRAWAIFRSGHEFYSRSFSLSLQRAWEVEKANLKYRIEEAEKAARIAAEQERLNKWWSSEEYKAIKDVRVQPSLETMESYYRSGVYSGD